MQGDVSRAMLQELCADLRLTWQQAGGPGLRTLGAQVRLGKSQVGAILNGRIRQPPAWDVVRSLIDCIQTYAREHGTLSNLSLRMGVEEFWRPRYTVLEHAFRQEQRRAGGRAATPAPGRAGVAPPGPPGRGPAVVPRQLPPAVRNLAGRSAELRALTSLTDLSTAPGATTVIAIIDGTAGVGKTTLAVAWAHRVADRFPDGQLYVNLRGFDPAAPAMDPAEAVGGFLDAFDVPAQHVPARLTSQIALFRSLVAGRRLLVVLDNARDADQVRPLLPGAPGCLVVVTSRNRLTSLVATEQAHPITLGLLSGTESRDLLAGRVGAERVAAAPGAAEKIVAACDRLPLALSIVAAHAVTQPAVPLDRIAAQLHRAASRLDLLDSGEPDEDLRAVFSWSYRTLSPPAGRLFRLLGLPVGREISTVAAASLAGIPVRQASLALAELHQRHMVGTPAPGRYALHDLLRAYAAELAQQVEPAVERDDAVRRLLDHYLHTAYAAVRLLYPHRGPVDLVPAGTGAVVDAPAGIPAALAWLAAEHAVLTDAVRCAADAGLGHHTWQLAWSVSDFLQRRGHWYDWLTSLRTGLVAARRQADLPGQAHLHHHLGLACAMLGRHDEALAHLHQALEHFAGLGDRAGSAAIHLGLGSLLVRLGSYGEALDHDRRALHLYRAAGHRVGQALALNNTAWKHTQIGQYRRAIEYGEQALDRHDEAGNPQGAADAWDTLGYAYHRLGEHRRAVDCYLRALDLFRRRGDHYYEAGTLTRLGDTYAAAGDGGAARSAWEETLDILHHLGHPDADQVRARLRPDLAVDTATRVSS
ncbi:ATP-binding protein [Plantactinospora sp. WMMB334]|uniref:ATP-binding protein n=1 Tax=Plantactinospora sp. WMMB334 TaxID=3404119 RepID=UPI003B9450AB